MKRLVSRTFLLAALTALYGSVAAAQDLSLDEVLKRHYEAIGGLDKVKSVMTRRMTGRMSIGQGMEATFTAVQKRPMMTRMEFTFQGMTGVQAFDGQTAWMLMPFMGQTAPEVMPADQAKAMIEEADFDGPLVDYASKGHQVELVGTEEVEGTSVYKLKVTLKNGEISYYFLDREYFLPIRTEQKRKIQGMELDVRTILGDYKEVDGMMVPFSIQVSGQGPGAQAMTIDKIEFNIPLDDQLFKMPAK